MRFPLFILVCILATWLTPSQAQQAVATQVITLALGPDSMPQRIVDEPQLYTERWDTLPQIQFWRQVMTLTPDSAVLNIARTRQILEVFDTQAYDTLSSAEKKAWKEEKCAAHGIPLSTRLYVTYGKQDYYQFEAVMHTIDKGILQFEEQGVDPWYAQAILLIESPGQMRLSHTGAYGAFQLMKSVAIEEGLVVNSRIDEREDFDKSSTAAARFIKRVCIPETRRILDRKGLNYREDAVWFRLMVLHVYHAGAGNVSGVISKINPQSGGMPLITELWRTRHRGFGNASQNYSQVALAACLELDALVLQQCTGLCQGVDEAPFSGWRQGSISAGGGSE